MQSSIYYMWLLSSVDVVVDDGHVYLMHANGRVINIEDPGGLVSELLQAFDGNTPSDQWKCNPLANMIEEQLTANGWVARLSSPLSSVLACHSALSREFSYLAHQYPSFPDRRFEALRTKRALIVGAGGVGTAVSYALCAAGIGRLSIFDPDCIEESNLNRQFLYDRNSLGHNKALVLTSALSSRFPSTEIEGDSRDFDAPSVAQNAIATIDLVIVCGESRILYREPSICAATPLLLAGYQGLSGIIGPLVDPLSGTACWPCLMAKHRPDQIDILHSASTVRRAKWNPSGAANNLAVGAHAATLATRFLSQDRAPDMAWGRRIQLHLGELSLQSTQCLPISCEHST